VIEFDFLFAQDRTPGSVFTRNAKHVGRARTELLDQVWGSARPARAENASQRASAIGSISGAPARGGCKVT
jgi:hypothetical protein